MSDDILLKFSDVNLLDVKGDDDKLEKLSTVSKVLSIAVKKSPAKAILFTMAAADPSISEDDPSIKEALHALRETWKTVGNLYSGTPRVLLRPVMLEAVVQAARGNESIAVAFVNSARNTLPYVESSDEAPIWVDAVKEIEALVDARAEAEWATPETISIPVLDFKVPQLELGGIPPIELDGKSLNTKMIEAVTSYSQHPNNNIAGWGQHFAARMSTAITEVFDDTFSSLKVPAVDISAPLKGLANAMAGHIQETLKSFSGATAGLQRRTNLLWWKEALYSTSAKASYRDMPAFQAAALMALDLFEQVPVFSPASVVAFLNETIRLLPTKAGEETQEAFRLVVDARTAVNLLPLRTAASRLAPSPTGRGPILSLIGHVNESGGLDEAKLRELGGITSTASLTAADWGTLLFRELQATRATSSTPAKRARSKD